MEPVIETDEVATIVVETPETTDEATVDAGDTTVIVDTGDAEGETIDPFTERFVRMEARLETVESKLYELVTYREAQEIAESAAAEVLEEALEVDEAIVDAVDESIVESIESAETVEDADGDEVLEVQDIAPTSAKVHVLFRPAKDLFKRG